MGNQVDRGRQAIPQNIPGVEQRSAYPDVILTEHSERRIRGPLGPDSFQAQGDTGGSKNMSKRKAVYERGTRLWPRAAHPLRVVLHNEVGQPEDTKGEKKK